jgi:hypothetical protein
VRIVGIRCIKNEGKCSAFDAKENGTGSYSCVSKVQQNTVGDLGNNRLTAAGVWVVSARV